MPHKTLILVGAGIAGYLLYNYVWTGSLVSAGIWPSSGAFTANAQ
jgi:hypothetical protein